MMDDGVVGYHSDWKWTVTGGGIIPTGQKP